MEEGRYYLTREGFLMAWVARAESEGKELTVALAFKYATEGRGILQYILCSICVCICAPIGFCSRRLR